MHIPIDPKKEYTPTEIARNGFIKSKYGNKNPLAIVRRINLGKLKARAEYPFGNKLKVYKIKGSDLIAYIRKFGTS
jgi:hypothetical protein